MADIRDVLIDLGYRLQDHGREFRMSPLYRDSDNNSVLRVYKDTGWWTDFKECKSGPFEELVRMTLGLSNIDQARDIILTKYKFVKPKREEAKLEHVKALSKEIISNLVEDYSYWGDRGISPETLSIFNGGKATQGEFYGRYVFPIFNSRNTLIGATARDTTNKSPIKWKHKGPTSKWGYPLAYNYNLIKDKKEVILVESIGDMLALWEAGIKNAVVTFGLRLSSHLLACILKLDPDRIVVALNNDDQGQAGNKAAYGMRKLLVKHFDDQSVTVKLPCKNDFGCMNKKEILEWRNR